MSKSTEVRLQEFPAPAAPDNVSVLAAQTLPTSGTTVVTSGITNPDVARTIRLKGNQSTTQGLVVVLNGIDILGNTVTESVTMGAAFATPTDSLHAFAKLTSITFPTRGASSDSISVGKGAALGLDSYCDENSFADIANNAKKALQQAFGVPAAASATYVHAAISTAVLTTSGITNPDVPRVASITGAGSSHTASGNVVINGTDIQGNTISDTIALSGNSTVNGVKAFKTITSIDTTGVTGIDTNDTVEVGIAAALGLEAFCDQYSFQGFAGVTSYTYNASVLSQNTVITTTAPNGSASLAVVYMPALFPNAVGVSSYTYNTSVISLNTIVLNAEFDGATDRQVAYYPESFPTFNRPWG